MLPQHLTPRVMFLSSLTTVLVGVTYADGQLADEEIRYLQRVLSQFVAPDSASGQMISLMMNGVRKHRTYAHQGSLKCLTQTLSESEKLIILCFGCRLAAADGCTEDAEKRYLCQVAAAMSMPAKYVGALFLLTDGKPNQVDEAVANELRCLIDPQRFQSIDKAIVKAASFLQAQLFTQIKPVVSNSVVVTKPSYAKLEKFQGHQEQLSAICGELEQLLSVEGDISIFPAVLTEEVKQLAERVRSQKFRLAIVGEFSQGKSTFLNALLGEELQPVRAIPCSGTLTTLKYGPERRVVCHYKDGTQAAIPFDQYQQQASIPEEAALGNREFELKESNIVEIVLEHPALELCRHHVEIVDSPGLNEHPDRTAVTERLLEDADAAIFLANAQRPLTKGERDLLQSLKARLTQNSPDEPAENLFVLVNFMDLLRSQKDKEQVQTLFCNFINNKQAPIVKSDNRMHFVSARSALEATLTQKRNEYSAPFDDFVSALETFLVEERGELSLKSGISDVKRFISGIQDGFVQTTDLLEGRLSLSEAEQQKLLNQAGDVSGLDVTVRVLKGTLVDESLEAIDKSWNEWIEKLDECLLRKKEHWTTQHEDKKLIVKDYAEQFVQDISEELDKWLQETVMHTILKPKVDKLDKLIQQSLKSIHHDLKSIDEDAGTNLREQFELANMGVNLRFHSSLDADAVSDATGFWGDLGLKGGGGIAAAGALAFVGFGLWPILLTGGVAGTLVSWMLGKDLDTVKSELKNEAFNKGVEKFIETSDAIIDRLVERIEAAFDQNAQAFHERASKSIAMLCNLLEQQEIISRETLVQKEIESALIKQKSLQLKEIENSLDQLSEKALA